MFAAGTWDSKLVTPFVVLGAMYGNYGVSIPFDHKSQTLDSAGASHGFLKDGKMMQPRFHKPQNTTLSALITLREFPVGQAKLAEYYARTQPDVKFHWDPDIQAKVDFDISERQLGVIVWENVYAAVPLSRALFSGEWDERWAHDGKEFHSVHIGRQLAEFEKAYPRTMPLGT